MPIAYQEQAQLSCPDCHATFEAAVWLILDAQEQPEAVEALRQNQLNLVRCPSCGTTGPAGAPLLYHDALARRVIFAPPPGAAEHEWRDQARELHAVLVGSLPEEQRRPYLADVDIAQDLAGVAHLLRRAAKRAAGRTTRATSAEALPVSVERAAAVRSPAPVAPAPDEPAPPLLLAVEAMLSANTSEELEQVLAAHPVLLHPSTEQTLVELAQVAVEQRAYEVAESLREARALLARMRDTGLPPHEVAVSALPELALQALLQAQSVAEIEATAAANPLLLRPEIDQLLAELVEQALDAGHERRALVLEERREALAQLRLNLAEQRPPAPPEQTAPLASLDEAIEALLLAEGETALTQVIERYPFLLEEVAGQALWQFAAEARSSGDEELARYAIECREMLARVRKGLSD